MVEAMEEGMVTAGDIGEDDHFISTLSTEVGDTSTLPAMHLDIGVTAYVVIHRMGKVMYRMRMARIPDMASRSMASLLARRFTTPIQCSVCPPLQTSQKAYTRTWTSCITPHPLGLGPSMNLQV